MSLQDSEDESRRQVTEDVVAVGGFKGGERGAAVRSAAVRYLTYNRNLLPMFAYPGQL